MPKRSEKRDTAKAEYAERRSRGEKVNLREFADKLDVNYKTLRDWKRMDNWDGAVIPPKKKRGGQPGNANSKGHKNAAGSHPGAPPGNKNAEKDGAYSTVFFDSLTDEEKSLIEQMPLESKAALEHEMKILKFRENKILLKIAEYEAVPEESLYISSVLDMREPKGGQDGAKQKMGMYTKDSAFNRVMKLQEALYKVQGRIAKIADSLRMMEEFGTKLELEQQRLEVLRMRATGIVDVPDGGDGVDGLIEIELEDVKPEAGEKGEEQDETMHG